MPAQGQPRREDLQKTEAEYGLFKIVAEEDGRLLHGIFDVACGIFIEAQFCI